MGSLLLVSNGCVATEVGPAGRQTSHPEIGAVPEAIRPPEPNYEPAIVEGPILFPRNSGARLEQDGTLVIFYAVSGPGFIGEGHSVYTPDNPNYEKVREELRDLPVGKVTGVPEHLWMPQ